MARKEVMKGTAGETIPEADIITAAKGKVPEGFHLRSEGKAIIGYLPGEDFTQPAQEQKEKGSAVKYGYFKDNGEVEDGTDKIREDGRSLIQVFFNRNRYAVYLRHENKRVCDQANCFLSEWNQPWDPEANITIYKDGIWLKNDITLPIQPFIVKEGESLYKRFYADKKTSSIFTELKESNGWGCWARWARIPNSADTDDTYQADLFHTPKESTPPHNAFDVMNGAAYGLKDGADSFTIKISSGDEKVLHNVLRIERIGRNYDPTTTTILNEYDYIDYYYDDDYDTHDEVRRDYDLIIFTKGIAKDLWLNKTINGFII